MSANRDQWGSRLGFVLAASGSAVGLGNLWKFPYITYHNGGGGFVLIYLGCIALIGMPIMLAEILIGRRAQASPVPAFEKLAQKVPGQKKWGMVGWLGVAAGVTILSFYSVIAGWSLSSFLQCMDWSINGYEAPAPDDFGNFLGNGPLQLGLTLVFSTLTAIIVMRGISGGIEKATKILMPVLLAILLFLVGNSFTLEGAGEALSFLFTPDFSHIKFVAVLEALGHAFFTLSLGMGAMITYGSYMGKKDSILKAGGAIVVLDTLIALFACIIMFSIIFSYQEIRESVSGSTVGMLFITVPKMFYTKMALGAILGPVFYILVAFAALSSTISLLEVVVSLLVDKMEMSRAKATLLSASGIFVVSILCALSLGANDFLSGFKVFGHSESGFFAALNDRIFPEKAGILNLLDHLAANWLLPIGGFCITIFVGWFMKTEDLVDELDLRDENGQPNIWFTIFHFCLRYIAPVAIGAIIVAVLMGWKDFA